LEERKDSVLPYEGGEEDGTTIDVRGEESVSMLSRESRARKKSYSMAFSEKRRKEVL